MRLIDADALKREMITALVDATRNPDIRKFHLSVRALDKIDEAKTVDAMPIKHAHWKSGDKFYNVKFCKQINAWICSECGKCSLEYSEYCPNCGAKMDDED